MWNDVVVGRGNSGCSALLVFDIPGNTTISQNSTSYWISDVYAEIGMTIFKDTVEGTKLTAMIKNQAGLNEITDYVREVMIRHVNVKHFIKKVDFMVESMYDAGKQAKAAEIREVLGV